MKISHALRYAVYDKEKSFKWYKPFNFWRTPYAKQYDGDQTLCGQDVDFSWRPQ